MEISKTPRKRRHILNASSKEPEIIPLFATATLKMLSRLKNKTVH